MGVGAMSTLELGELSYLLQVNLTGMNHQVDQRFFLVACVYANAGFYKFGFERSNLGIASRQGSELELFCKQRWRL